jgi:hypothetical protein
MDHCSGSGLNYNGPDKCFAELWALHNCLLRRQFNKALQKEEKERNNLFQISTSISKMD